MTSLLIYGVSIALKSATEKGAALAFSWEQLLLDINTTLPWLGAIFAACYAAFYARLAGQWSYLASLYNQLMAAVAAHPTPNESLPLLRWRVGFIADAYTLHLDRKPIFSSVISSLLERDDVYEEASSTFDHETMEKLIARHCARRSSKEPVVEGRLDGMPSILDRFFRVRDYLTDDFLGGPRIRFALAINLQKGGTLPFVLGLMWAYDCWTPTAWVYLGLHGSYGLVWLLKDAIFPDPSWEKKVTLAGALNAWLFVLGPYWIAPWLIVSQRIEQPPAVLGGAVLLYAIGLALMIGADAQKYFVLRARPGLIVDGFFARTRNPNYLGEMMLYAAFAVVAGHWLPWVVLAGVWIGLFLPNMLRKDARMARHPEWEVYRRRSGLLLPRLSAG